MSARPRKTLKKPGEITSAADDSGPSEQRLFRDSGSDDDVAMRAGSASAEHALATDDDNNDDAAAAWDFGEGSSKGKSRRASSVGSNATNRSVALSESSLLDLQAQETAEGYYEDAAAEDPEVIASIPVYLAKSLPAGASLQVFQYPTYSARKALPIPNSSKERGIYSSARWRPKANMVEVNLPLDMRRDMYNHETGEVMGTNLREETTAKGKGKVKKEEGTSSSSSERRPAKLNKIRLQSTEIPNATRYMVGVIRDGAMHLTRLDGVLQLRPSLHHLDAMDAAENEQKRRMKDGADSGGEEAGGSMAASKARTLNVSIKEDPNQGGARAKGNPFVDHREKIMASQRDAENEPWVELDWQDETGDHELLHAHLTSGSKAQLACNTRMSEFLPL